MVMREGGLHNDFTIITFGTTARATAAVAATTTAAAVRAAATVVVSAAAGAAGRAAARRGEEDVVLAAIAVGRAGVGLLAGVVGIEVVLHHHHLGGDEGLAVLFARLNPDVRALEAAL